VSADFSISGRRAAEISASVEQGVARGALAPGEHLPPVRDLAARLGVNPNTVASAYRQLKDRGVVETAGRRGTRVRSRPSSTPRDAIGVSVPPGAVDLSLGNPSRAQLPDLTEALAASARAHAEHPVLYGRPAYEEMLIGLARERLRADSVPTEHLAVANGSLDAIERILLAHLRPGDAVAVEDPGWGSLLDLIPALGLTPVPVGVDDEGPLAEDVEAALVEGARALIVTSRAQNPTGAALSGERAERLREVLGEHSDTLLIEDDHGYGIVDVPLHPMCGITEHWALVRSAAKSCGPDLRVAVLTGDRVTVSRVAGRLRLGAGWVSHLLQRTVAELWRAGLPDAPTVAAAYRARREALLTALRLRGVPAHGASGLNVWVPVPDETGAVSRLLAAGWGVAPGARFRIASPPGLRITVSELPPEDAEGLAEALAAAVHGRVAERLG
jgi:DNA-binding transcriptional MocR family regulator